MATVSKSKKACILSHALWKLDIFTFYRGCLREAWVIVKKWDRHDMAYLLAYCRMVNSGEDAKAALLYRDSMARGVGADFRRVVRLLGI